MHSGDAGRPCLNVDVHDILELRKLHFKWTKIASILGISRSTLYRRLNQAGITPTDYSDLSNQELDETIQSIKADHPNDGEVLLRGHLLRKGVRVRRESLRQAIHRVDSTGVSSRSLSTIRRRVYSVPFPNFVWHIDGNHKLIRWHFVVHGAIDGFSRLITSLKCADNNRATTVLKSFKNGISIYGIPCKVRSDYGGENIDVWRFMIASHGLDYTSVISGSSVHNERVERLWRDVNRSVSSVFRDVFRSLESEGVLDPLNDVDLYCLHYIFLPRINKSLSEFQLSWNNHGLSSESNMTPIQLHFEGLHCLNSDEAEDQVTTPADGVNDVAQASLPHGDHVEVPRHSFSPCSLLLQELSAIQPLETCFDHGRSLYTRAIHIVGNHLQINCSQCAT